MLTLAPFSTSSFTVSWSPPLAAMCKEDNWQGDSEKWIIYKLAIQKLTSSLLTYSDGECKVLCTTAVIKFRLIWTGGWVFEGVCSNPPPFILKRLYTPSSYMFKCPNVGPLKVKGVLGWNQKHWLTSKHSVYIVVQYIWWSIPVPLGLRHIFSNYI